MTSKILSLKEVMTNNNNHLDIVIKSFFFCFFTNLVVISDFQDIDFIKMYIKANIKKDIIKKVKSRLRLTNYC